VTWQVSPRNKIGFSYDQAVSEEHPRDPGPNSLTEAALNSWAQLDPKRIPNLDWNSPVTNRLLLEASALHHLLGASRTTKNVMFTNPAYPPDGPVKLQQVQEQSTGLTYRATPQAQYTHNESLFWRAAVSYITGAHAFKVGFNYGKGTDDQVLFAVDSPISYRFKRRAEPPDAAGAADPQHHQAACRPRDVRAGQMDGEQADRQRRPALRLLPCGLS
jgi:hypothetical protein